MASQYCLKSFASQDRNEKLGKGTLLFSRKFLVSKKFYGYGGGGGYHDFAQWNRKYVSEIVKISDTGEIRTWTYRFRTYVPLQNVVVLTPLLTFIFVWKELAILDWKKENRPYWMNNFSCILHMRQKVKIVLHPPPPRCAYTGEFFIWSGGSLYTGTKKVCGFQIRLGCILDILYGPVRRRKRIRSHRSQVRTPVKATVFHFIAKTIDYIKIDLKNRITTL